MSLVCRLDPAVDEVGQFPDAKHRSLSYGMKQLIAREIDIEKMRHETPSQPSPRREGPKTIAKAATVSSLSEEKERQDPPKGVRTPSHLQKLQAKQINVKEKSPVDFFGRKIDVGKISHGGNSSKADMGQQKQSDIISSDIWFKFKEGYNNAVRRHLKMTDLC